MRARKIFEIQNAHEAFWGRICLSFVLRGVVLVGDSPGRIGELRSVIYLADALCEIQSDSHCSGGPRYSVSALARNCLRGDATVALCKL